MGGLLPEGSLSRFWRRRLSSDVFSVPASTKPVCFRAVSPLWSFCMLVLGRLFRGAVEEEVYLPDAGGSVLRAAQEAAQSHLLFVLGDAEHIAPYFEESEERGV